MKFKSRLNVPEPKYIESDEDIDAALRRCFASDAIAIDTETLGTQHGSLGDQVVCAGISPDEHTRYFVPRRKLYRFKSLFSDTRITKIFHNYVFDAHRLANAGVSVDGPIACTLSLDWLYDEDTRENRHSLDHCALDYFGIVLDSWKEIVGKTNPLEIVPGHERWDRFLDYGTLDAWITRKLYFYLKEKLEKIPLTKKRGKDFKSLWDLYWNMEQDQLKCLFDMERRGVSLDLDYLNSLDSTLEKEMEDHAKAIYKEIGKVINIDSPKQISDYLYKELRLKPPKRTPSGAPSCDESVLTYFAEKKKVTVCVLILKYRKAGKTKRTYVKGLLTRLQHDGKLHTSYSPIKLTGRLGSSNPNLQNLPRPSEDPYRIRSAFIADSGCVLIVADYAQLEMRIMAIFSRDPAFCKGIREGKDMHSYTGSLMLGIPYEEFLKRKKNKDPFILAIRQAAKAVGFGLIYGIGPKKLAADLTIALGRLVTVEEAEKYIADYLETFPGIDIQIKKFKQQARTRGYVQTYFGRYRRLSKIRSSRWSEKGHAERQAVNTPIQGTAADLVKVAMIRCNRSKKLKDLGCTVILQVHDELVFNCPKENAKKAVPIIKEIMDMPTGRPLLVPTPAEPMIVVNWAEAK